MKNYEKPVVLVNEDVTEGVYAASGCFTETWVKVQEPELGQDQYCFQIDAHHDANHINYKQMCTVTFNAPVSDVRTSVQYGDVAVAGNVVTFYRSNKCNEIEDIGFGCLYATSVNGTNLEITSVVVEDVFE